MPIEAVRHRQLDTIAGGADRANQPVLTTLFARSAEAFADRTALVEGDRKTTYAELDAMSDRVAARLRDNGVAVGEPVGVHLARRTELYAVMLGVLKAGACVVPLNPEHPALVVDRIVAEAGLRVLVHDDARSFDPPLRTIPVEDAVSGDGAPPQTVPLTGESPAYLMFTSGSTGRPKGVRIAHRGLARLGPDQGELAVTEHDTLVQLAAYSFAASTIEIWLSLLHGATLVVPPPGLPSLGALRDLVRRNGVTVLSMPGGLFNLVVSEEPDTLRGLRAVLLSGDFPSPSHLARATELVDVVYNGYGCTENSTISLVYPMRTAEDVTRHDRVPVGRPLPGVEALILDDDLRPCPPGEVGQLCLGGAGVALGYLDPALTAEKFADGQDGPLYRTGDLARRTADGDVILVGRADSMVKIRGFRVETSEVELALREHPAVRQAVVKAFGDHTEEKRLVAFYSTVDGQAGDPAVLLAHLAERVPRYALPAQLRHLDQLPHNVNGKIDRAALTETDALRPTAKGDITMSDSAALIEPVVLQAWRDISGAADFTTTDSFLGHGGNSLHFVQLAHRLQKIFAVDVETEDVFRHGTVEQLAAFIDGARERQSVGR
ncbi:non-ribosomal peptide synthetase [Kutzneria kofuensis]|uniref:Amino acid adenylation domain-containing protein n=1 Tax=Kutzneria kofuensis TaxID=103725 RepID=A0A7W9KS87_9PSEU|nr:non-ribosomal peptide synthetase [Kutzneria kofuensis]MBB5897796.1 amino acid adenylation domain-containing protein [Kutzneria kofuensis]